MENTKLGNSEVTEKDVAPSSHTTSDFFVGPMNSELTVETRYAPSDVKGPASVHGSCGLYNLGNTCFMNSGIQCLASCVPLLKFFFERFRTPPDQQGTLTAAFYRLLCKLWSGRFTVLQPRSFKELLGLYHPQFQDYRQHDCQEFLALLLDTFHEQLNQVASPTSTPASTPLPSIQPAPGSPDPQTQLHLNNEDLNEAGSPSLKPGGPDASPASLLCSETLPAQQEDKGGGEVPLREPPGPPVDMGQGRGSLKRASPYLPEGLMAALASEDSNQSTLSAHSSDSEQSSAFKKLKIETENGSPASVSSSSLGSACDPIGAGSDFHVPPAVSCVETKLGNAAGELMDMSPPCHSSIPHKKGAGKVEESSHHPPSSLLAENAPQDHEQSPAIPPEGKAPRLRLKKFNNKDPSPSVGAQSETSMISSIPSTTVQNDLPLLASSPVDSSESNPLHFYCKETKTLNTNVLVSNFVQGDVAMDSEKFAKVDNRCQVPVPKEVNLLQETLPGMEEDKVDKPLIGKALGSGKTTAIIAHATRDHAKPSAASNLRSVKSLGHGGGMLRKSSGDPNLLNNSYDYEDEVLVGYSSLVGASLHKGGKSGADTALLECVKPALGQVSLEKKQLAPCPEMVSSEVEKNVQMQALSKLRAKVAKSNIREDISDKASTSESAETEDADMEAEGESSASEDEKEEEEEEEPLSRGSVTGDDPGLPNAAHFYSAADVTAANEAWERYRMKNNSMVVDTFQGQFKSTVVCSECSHVSVTYEPFMYLSLPIPFAMERQICVVFVRPHKSTVRYMLALHKNDKVQRLRRQLQTMTATENTDVVLAEVLNNHISRVLEDNMMLRYVNDTNRTIHAFQMLPPPQLPSLDKSPPPENPPPDLSEPPPLQPRPDSPEWQTVQIGQIPDLTIEVPASGARQEGGGYAKGAISVGGASEAGIEGGACVKVGGCAADGRSAGGDLSGGSSSPGAQSSPLLMEEGVEGNPTGEKGGSEAMSCSSVDSAEPLLRSGREVVLEAASKLEAERFSSEDADFGRAVSSSDPLLMGTSMWDWSDRRDFPPFSPSHPPCTSAPPTSPTSLHSGNPFPSDMNLNADCPPLEGAYPQSPSSMDVEMDYIPPAEPDLAAHIWGEGGTKSVVDQWQTCAICLEEVMDSQLLTHMVCSGVFCHNCLEMSAKHSEGLANNCPVCLLPVDVTQDFVPLASGPFVKSKIRILAVPITFRTSASLVADSGEGASASASPLRLVCGPRLCYLASQQDAAHLYMLVDKVVPFVAAYTLHFTDGQGLRCSRCEYATHCSGCEVSRSGEISLQPGDNLAVHFNETLNSEAVEDKTHVSEDASLQHLRSKDPISIFDCFKAFTQSEVLDEHNPWYCPCCRRNQCAKKTMTVWRYPENLIIHLKRFVYEDLSSTKIDNRVVFPHSSLDVTQYLAGPHTSFNLYDLYSIVCHYGGANSGHYTAFCCHPITQVWYNYNDESVSQQSPGDSEFDSGYVLFYQRQGPRPNLDLSQIPLAEEEEVPCNNSLAVVPYQAGVATFATLPSATVTFQTDGLTVVNDTLAASEPLSEQNFDFYN